MRSKKEEMIPLVSKRIETKDRVGREYFILRELSQELQDVIYGPAKEGGALVVTVTLEK